MKPLPVRYPKKLGENHVVKRNRVHKNELHLRNARLKRGVQRFRERNLHCDPFTFDAKSHCNEQYAKNLPHSRGSSRLKFHKKHDATPVNHNILVESDHSVKSSETSDSDVHERSDSEFSFDYYSDHGNNALSDEDMDFFEENQTEYDDRDYRFFSHKSQQQVELISISSNSDDSCHTIPRRENLENRKRPFNRSVQGDSRGNFEVQDVVPALEPIDSTLETEAGAPPKCFVSHETGNTIVIAEHPSTFTLHGKVQVSAISGTVDILGYTLTPSSKNLVSVYSFDKLFNLQVRTLSSDQKCANYWSSIRLDLKKYVSEDLVRMIVALCKDTSVLILLKKQDLAYEVDFVSNHIPRPFTLYRHGYVPARNKGFDISNKESNVIKVTKYHSGIADVIDQAIRSCIDNCVSAPRVLIYGERGSGKSTSLRYFVNRVLSNSWGKVLYLDCDPGQTEFTPPGCLSLTEVTEPLLGPPFTHLKKPLKMVFYGSISLDDPDSYTLCVGKLVEHYMNNCTEQVLFVNTLGWVKGLGKKCLTDIQELIKPNIIIELTENRIIPPEYNANVFLKSAAMSRLKDQLHFQLPCAKLFKADAETSKKDIFSTPETKRELAIFSYFGQCYHYYSLLKAINIMKPICICTEDVTIHVMKPMYKNCFLHAIAGTLVALCHTDDSQLLILVDDKYSPGTLTPNGDFGECLGFGIVRSIDIGKKVIYLITPEPLSVLQKVNIIVRGDIALPKVIRERGEIFEKGIPYTMNHSNPKIAISRRVKKKTSFPRSSNK